MALSLVTRPAPHARRARGSCGVLLLMAAALGSATDCGGSDGGGESAGDGGAEDAPSGFPSVVLDGGGEVPEPPNGEDLCAEGTCNYQSQEGCAANQACTPVFAGGQVNPGCTAAGPRTLGQECEQWTDCARGQFCADGVCRKLCCGGDWTGCPEGQSCIRQLSIRDPRTQAIIDAGVDLCFPVGTCDVLDVDSCAEEPGRSCQIVDPLGNVACARAGSAALGEECSVQALCGAGMSCVGGRCRQLCRAVAGVTDTGCQSGESCIHYRRDPPDVGECTPLG